MIRGCRGAESGSLVARSNVVRELFDEVRTALRWAETRRNHLMFKELSYPFRPVLVDCITDMSGFDLLQAHCRAELTNCDTA